MNDYDLCTCGHTRDLHDMAFGCDVEDCGCFAFEEAEE